MPTPGGAATGWRPRDVGIDVDGHVDALVVRSLDPLERLRYRAPVPLARDREMRDLEPAAAAPGDREGFIHGVEEVVAVVAHVDGEQPVPARHGPPDVDQLVEVGRHGGRIHQAGRHADRPIRKTCVNRLDQGLPFLARQRPRRLPGDPDPEWQVANERRRVERQTRVLQRAGVPGEIGPVPGHARVRIDGGVGGAGQTGHCRREGDTTHPAVAVDLGRHALGDLAAGSAVAQQGQV